MFDHLLQHSVDILVSTTTAELGTGGRVESHATARAAAVPCLIAPASSGEQEMWSGEGLVATHKVAFSGTGSGVQRGDVLQWSDPAGTSVLLRVTGIQLVPAMGGIDGFTYVYCSQVQ